MNQAPYDMRIYGDLNIPSSPPERLNGLITTAFRLGYSAIALTKRTDAPLRASDMCKIVVPNISTFDSSSSSGGVSFDPSSAHASSRPLKRKRLTTPSSSKPAAPNLTALQVSVAGTASASSSSSSSSSSSKSSGVSLASALTTLTRLTVSVPSMRQASDISLSNPVLLSYDVVGVTPGDAETAAHAVASNAIDILHLDATAGKLPFSLSRSLINAAAAAGIAFEVEYAPAIRDATRRRFFVSNLTALTALTRGKGLLLTSSAEGGALELRSPTDVAALASLGGLSREAALDALSHTVSRVLAHAEMRALSKGGSSNSNSAAASSSSSNGISSTASSSLHTSLALGAGRLASQSYLHVFSEPRPPHLEGGGARKRTILLLLQL